MVQRGLLLAAMLLASLSLGTTFAGESGDMRAVMERLQKLEADNAKLKADLHGRSSVRADVDRAISRSDATMGAVVSGTDSQCRPLVIHGYFDVSYQWNVAGPDNQNNNQRVFDNDSQGFNVHAAEIDFDRLPTKGGEAGFRLDLAYGTDAAKYQSSDNNPTFSTLSESGSRFSSGSDIVNLQQAYLSYIANVGNGVTIDMGKFVTWSGAEVIESADNINASRSLLFGAQPVTHTGVRGSYEVLSDRCGHKWVLGLSVQNGWDNVQDQNDSKTIGLMSNFQVTKWFNWVATAYAGNEQFADERARFSNQVLGNSNITFDSDAGSFFFPDNTGVPGVGSAAAGRIWDAGDSGDARLLLDTVLTFTPWEDLTFKAEGMYINDEPGVQWGMAGYVKWQFAKNWYIANRTEYFDDKHGTHFGVRQCTWESTLTLDWKLSDPLHLRFEYRHDNSNRDVFSSTKGVGNGGVNVFHPFRDGAQDTFMMQWVYKF